MLTAVCPNCRHRFPVPGYCNSTAEPQQKHIDRSTQMQTDYCPNQLRPSHCGCFINAPTIINGPTIIQTGNVIKNNYPLFNNPLWREPTPEVEINSSCDLSGGTVTITTPRIQSVIMGDDVIDDFNVQPPTIKIRPKCAGSGGVAQKRPSHDLSEETEKLNYYGKHVPLTRVPELLVQSPPSGCQELPGTRRSDTTSTRSALSSTSSSSNKCQVGNNSGVEIKINATVQLPPNVGQCTFNITATATSSADTSPTVKVRNYFNGGGIIGSTDCCTSMPVESTPVGSNVRTPTPAEWQRMIAAASVLSPPTTPVTRVARCPWIFDPLQNEKELAKLQEIKQSLLATGWYYGQVNCQESAKLLKNTSQGTWLLRDSSDSRFALSLSVQTQKGPTSVRIIYSMGKFRLDAEPNITNSMPTFDCPVKMMEYYIKYSKSIKEDQRHVWVDMNGVLFSQIYVTKPLVKEVRSLSHLARLAIDKSRLRVDNLPGPIRKFIDEYPFTL
uniref:SH2 domain-containing protein n=1 Tax=Bracon brevicornis TaxID=1563983 RepID=A0A6V7JXM2_9HYME